MPKPALIQKYSLGRLFDGFIHAVKQGNIQQFDRVAGSLEETLIQLGVYHVVQEQLRLIVYRNLLRRVFRLKSTPEARLDIPFFTSALRMQLPGTTADEAEGIIVNLIAKVKYAFFFF